jgi:O-antigen/teichoic acid export membrane protein
VGVFRTVLDGLKSRILADAAARVWNAALSFLLVPIYLRFIGVEAYGLIGVFVSLQSILALLDFGIGAGLTRELSRTTAQGGDWVRACNLTRTLEVVYWTLAGVATLVFFAAVPWINEGWLRPEKLSSSDVRAALYVGGAAIGAQWAGSFYVSGLLGLKKQRVLALVGVVSATVRSASTVVVLWTVSATVDAMLWVQAVVGLANTLVLMRVLWSNMPETVAPRKFDKALFKEVWRFATGMTGIGVTSVVLMQADKILLCKLLSLEQFGYYMLAVALAGGLYLVVAPIFSVAFPRFSDLFAKGSEHDLAEAYHVDSQILSVVLLPAACILILFSQEILFTWTGDADVADHSKWIVALLAFGNALNGLMNVPFALQLAAGWTSLAFYRNLGEIAISIPLLWELTTHYGVIGAASVWPLLGIGSLLVSQQILHAKLLQPAKWTWYWEDVGQPLLASLLLCLVFRATLPSEGRFMTAASLLMCFLIAVVAVAFSATRIRLRLSGLLRGPVAWHNPDAA